MALIRRLLSNVPQSQQLTCRYLGSVVANEATAIKVVPEVQESTPDKLFQKVYIELKGHDKAVLKSYTTVLKAAASHLEIPSGDINLVSRPTLNRLTLLRSAHIYKKHRVQYEMRTYHANFALFRLTGSTADTYLEYIQRMLPEGVGMKVTKTEINPLPDYMSNSI